MKTKLFLHTILILIIFSGFFGSCKTKNHHPAEKKKLIETDEAFSRLSEKDGMKKAFLANFAKKGILLRPNSKPINGIEEIENHFKTFSDTGFTLTWIPSNAYISKEADMGFTYGIYTLTTKDTTIKGTYVTIWKRNQNGEWKAVLDSGNEGIGN